MGRCGFGAAAEESEASRRTGSEREEFGRGGVVGQPDGTLADEYRDGEVLDGRWVCEGGLDFGDLGVPERERFFPIHSVLRVELVEQRASGVDAAEVEVGFDEIVADRDAVEFELEQRFGEAEKLGQVAVGAEVAAELLKEVGGNGTRGEREGGVVEGQGFVELSAGEGVASEPEPGAPALRKCGDALECGEEAGVAFLFSEDGGIPAEAVFLIGIKFEAAPERAQGFVVRAAFGVNFGEVDEDQARLAVPLEVAPEDFFGIGQTPLFAVDDGENDGAAFGVGVDGGEAFGGLDHVGAETVLERLNDGGVELVGVVPDFLDVAEEDAVAPLLLGDEDLPAVGIEDLDQVRIFREIRCVRGGRRRRRRFAAKKLSEKTHALEEGRRDRRQGAGASMVRCVT
jgi:hypothetical protein